MSSKNVVLFTQTESSVSLKLSAFGHLIEKINFQGIINYDVLALKRKSKHFPCFFNHEHGLFFRRKGIGKNQYR